MIEANHLVASGGAEKVPPRPFAKYALQFHKLGFSIIPCFNKKPAIKSWKGFQSTKPSKNQIEKWIEKFPNANIGIIAGAVSNLTVVDCDNLNLSIEELEKEFGESKFIVSTPSGGTHLYYCFNGEKKAINFDGRKIDLISEGCFIIAPYSFNAQKNAFYSVFKGGFDDLACLTHLKANVAKIGRKIQVFSGFQVDGDLKIEEGQRNDYLFYQLKKIAPSVKDYSTLETRAFEINVFAFSVVLSEGEVVAVAKSVWSYKVGGCLFNEGGGGVFIKHEELEKLAKQPRAIVFLLNLRKYHDGINRHFCIDQEKTAKKFQMTKKTLRKQIEVLIKYGFLKRLEIKNKKVFRGSKIKASPYYYSLC